MSSAVVLNPIYSLIKERFVQLTKTSSPVFKPYEYEYNGQINPTVVWPNDEAKQAFILPPAYSSPDIVCHKNSIAVKEFVEVAAGDSINLEWTAWPISHVGPIITYLAPAGVEDFSKVDKENLQFVKIEELGKIRNGTDKAKPQGYYASDKLIDAGNKLTVTIPPDVAPGNFVLRHEIIALMGASDLNKAQAYPQCINIKVTGNGKDPLASGTRAQDLYKATDPGIHVGIYVDVDYQIPGPALYKFDGVVPAIESTSKSSAAPVSAAPTTLVTKSSVAPILGTPTPAPSAATTSAVLVGTSATLISENSSVPARPNNATLYPSFVHSPSKTPSAASAPNSTPSGNTNQNGYNYDFSGFGDSKTGTETATEEAATKEGATKEPATETAGVVKSDELKTHSYNAAADEKPTTASTDTELTADDFNFPKNATVEQLIAFLEKILKALKKKVLSGKRQYARDFSSN